MFGRGAHGELVHVGLAKHDAARSIDAFRDVGIEGADEPVQDAAPGGRGLTAGHHQILERDRDAEERREGGERLRSRAPSLGQTAVGQVGAGPGSRVVEEEPGVQATVRGMGQLQVRIDEFARAERTGTQPARHLVGAEAGQTAVRPHPQSAPSTTTGTTK
jgi:hypothetical protein